MAAAELTLVDLQQLVQATILQSQAISDAGAKTVEHPDGLQDSLYKYASSSAKAFDALATTTMSSLARMELTLGRVLVVHNSLDAILVEMRKSLEGSYTASTLSSRHQTRRRPRTHSPHG